MVSAFGVACQPPADWETYEVEWGDTLWQIAEKFDTTTAALLRGNCLEDEMIYAGTVLLVPPAR